MATYKEIKGVTVQTRDTDPSLFVGSWSSGGALNTARYGGSGLGTAADSGLVAGSNPAGDLVEQYNGTSWTEIAEFNTARRINATGFGSVTAGLIMGGLSGPLSALTESWNGSAWTEVNDLNTGRSSYATSSGSPYTSGFIAGGHVAPAYSALGETELWDGTSWTETTNLNTSRVGTAGAGVSSTSGLAFGGVPNRAINESWDGSSWTEVGDMNTGREYVNGAGVQSSALVFAGRTSPPSSFKAQTESWDGSSWTEVADLATTRFQGMSGGVASSALYAGGEAPGNSSATEEFTFPSSPILVEGMLFLSGGTTLKGFGKAAGIPTATWASGGALNTGRFGLGAAGSQTANLVFAGAIPSPPQTNITESYNGTSWTEVNDMQRSTAVFLAGTGTQTAALGMAGENTTVRLSVVESWDGTNWTEIADVNTARGTAGAAGTQTAAFLVGGDASPGAFAGTELWNGSSWTEVNDLNTARNGINATMGTQTEALVAGGYQYRDVVESWDGTSWTETTDINTARGYSGGSGSQTLALVTAGQKSPNAASANSELWNGSSWTEVNDLSTARIYVGGSPTGSATSALITGGHPPYYTNTEEFTADATLSTVTVS